MYKNSAELLAGLVGLATGSSSGNGWTDDGFHLSGTLGFMLTGMDNELSLVFQYRYNGEGYDGAERNSLVDDVFTIINSLPPGSEFDTRLLGYLLSGASRHYAALAISKTKFLIDDLAVSLVVLANLSDLSGIIQPSIQLEVFEGMVLSLEPRAVWALDALWGSGDRSEYILLSGAPSVSLSIKANLGGGLF